jgi:hypothetical protein
LVLHLQKRHVSEHSSCTVLLWKGGCTKGGGQTGCLFAHHNTFRCDALMLLASQLLTHADETALHTACRDNENTPVIQYLVNRKKLNVNARNNVNETPLHFVADINAKNDKSKFCALVGGCCIRTNCSQQMRHRVTWQPKKIKPSCCPS